MQTSFKTISPIYKNKYSFVEENIKCIFKNKKVLDIGCGYGEYLELYQKNGFRATGIDIDKKAIKKVKDAKYGSIIDIPFRDKSFDVINCIDVFEHVDDEKKGFREISRVIKNKGMLIMTVPNEAFPATYDPINKVLMLFGKHIKIGMWYWHHKRLYSKKHLFSMFKRNKFKVMKYEQRSHFFIALFVNYLPCIIDKFIIKGGYRRKKIKKSILLYFVKMVYNILNWIDNLLFKKLNGINHCVVAVKI